MTDPTVNEGDRDANRELQKYNTQLFDWLEEYALALAYAHGATARAKGVDK